MICSYVRVFTCLIVTLISSTSRHPEYVSLRLEKFCVRLRCRSDHNCEKAPVDFSRLFLSDPSMLACNEDVCNNYILEVSEFRPDRITDHGISCR